VFNIVHLVKTLLSKMVLLSDRQQLHMTFKFLLNLDRNNQCFPLYVMLWVYEECYAFMSLNPAVAQLVEVLCNKTGG